MRLPSLLPALYLGLALNAQAALIGVDWAPDIVADGLASGTLGPLGVTLTSTDGGLNGGRTFPGNWPGRSGTNDVPGIAALGAANRNSIDWNTGQAGFATITFIGGLVTDPILLFDFTDPNRVLDFDDGLTLALLDQSPANSVSIGLGNVVTTDGSHSNFINDSFALQLTGQFTTFTITTNTNLSVTESFGFSIAVDDANVAVPEPAGLALLTAGLLAWIAGSRRRVRGRRPDSGSR